MPSGFDVLKSTYGREPVYIAEFYIDKCAEVYGVGPCTAAIGVTGDFKCYNSFKTCQDTPNYNNTSQYKFRFASRRVDGIQVSGEPPTFPTLLSVDIAPTVLDPGKGLGIRSSIRITMMDMPWTDVGTDPYLNDRSFNPELLSTFWRKWLSRHYYEGRRIDVLIGYLEEDGSYDASNFSRRTYFITKIQGPSPDGQIVVEAKDILKFADEKKTQIPSPSEVTLTGAISSGDTTLNVTDSSPFSVNGYIRINQEVMKITGVPNGTQIEVSRATFPSFYDSSLLTATSHNSGETVQYCKLIDNQRVDAVVNDILVNDVGIDSSFIDFAEWTSISDDWLNDHTYSTLITEPVGADELLGEISQHLILLWWSERDQKVKFDALKPAANSYIPVYNDNDHLVAEKIAFVDDPKMRVSRVYLYYGLANPIEDIKDKTNYKQIAGLIDLDAEGPNENNSKSILIIMSRFLDTNKSGVANEIISRLSTFYRNTKVIASYDLDQKDDEAWVGRLVRLDTQFRVNEVGQNLIRNYLNVRAKESFSVEKGSTLSFTALDDGRKFTCAIVSPDEDLETSPDPFPDYLDASDEERFYGFICDSATLKMSNGDPPYSIC